MLLLTFFAASAVVWTSVFGYVATLLVLAARRGAFQPAPPRRADENTSLPAIAVVVPVRNEQRYIAGKIANLRRTDYPAGHLRLVVADGGSTDATLEIVDSARDSLAMRVLRVPGARGKVEQINAALGGLDEEIFVFTDADAELDPACIRTLVETLQRDPGTDVVGARILPATRLLEERIHWWLLNSLWWLEGEALGNAQVSGVCFAVRRSAAPPLPADCTAEDIRYGLVASSRGRRVRLCRRAVATELRVPQTPREFASFRRRRGSGYVYELRRFRPAGAPARWHFMQALRLFHFFAMPVLALVVGILGAALLFTPDRGWPLAVFALFALPAVAALFASTTLGGDRRWRLGLAAGRLTGLVWLALLRLLASPRAALSRVGKGE